MECGSRRASTKARSRRGVDGVGQGVGKGRREGRLAEAPTTARVRGAAEEVGSGEDDRLDRPQQAYEQGLRASAGERRSVHLRGYEPPDAQAFGSLMRFFGQSLHALGCIEGKKVSALGLTC